MSESAFPALTEAQVVFKALIWDPIIATGEAALYLEAPILAAPILHTIDHFIIHEVSDWIFHQVVMLIDISAIKFINMKHQKAFDEASQKLQIYAIDYGIDSPEFLKAREDAKAAFVEFIRPSVG